MKLKILTAVSILIFIANKAAFGGVYKCIDQKGRVGYTDKPCQFVADGAKEVELPDTNLSQNNNNKTPRPIKSNVVDIARNPVEPVEPVKPAKQDTGQTDRVTEAINALLQQTAVVVAERSPDEEIAYKLVEQGTRDRGQIDSLVQAIGALRKLNGIADAKSRIAEAFEQFSSKETRAAQSLFEEVANTKEREAASQNKDLALQAKREASEAYRHLGALAFLSDKHKAINAYLKAVELMPDNANSWNQLGLLYRDVDQEDRAIDAFRKSLELGERLNDRRYVAWAAGNLGEMLRKSGDREQAKSLLEKSLDMEIELGRKEGIAELCFGIGDLFLSDQDFARAEQFYRNSLALYQELEDKQNVARLYHNLGYINQFLGKYDRAEKFLKQALDIFVELEDDRAIGFVKSQLSSLPAHRRKTRVSERSSANSRIEFSMDARTGKNNPIFQDGYELSVHAFKDVSHSSPEFAERWRTGQEQAEFDIPIRLTRPQSTAEGQPLIVEILNFTALQDESTLECAYNTGRSKNAPGLNSKRLLFKKVKTTHRAEGKFLCELFFKPFQLSVNYRVYDKTSENPELKSAMFQFYPRNFAETN